MDVSSVLVEFAIKNMKQQSVNNFISEIFKRFRDFVKVGEDEQMYQKLEYLIIKVMLTAKNFSEVIGLDNFLSLLNYFSSSVKFRLCEVMIDYFSNIVLVNKIVRMLLNHTISLLDNTLSKPICTNYRDRRGRDHMVVGFTYIYASNMPFTTKVRIPLMARCTRYNIM